MHYTMKWKYGKELRCGCFLVSQLRRTFLVFQVGSSVPLVFAMVVQFFCLFVAVLFSLEITFMTVSLKDVVLVVLCLIFCLLGLLGQVPAF